MGIWKSSDVSFDQFTALLTGASELVDRPSKSIAGPSESAGTAAGSGATSSAIEDFRGVVSAYVARNELPASIARIQNRRGSLRAIARMLIMGSLGKLSDLGQSVDRC